MPDDASEQYTYQEMDISFWPTKTDLERFLN